MAYNETKDEIRFRKTNLYLRGFGIDVNGNSIVKLAFVGGRGFSIQTNGILPKTNRISDRTIKRLRDIKNEDLGSIAKECINYIKLYGSKLQKSKLKIESGF